MRTTARPLIGPALAAAVCTGMVAVVTPAVHAAEFEPLEITPAVAAPGTKVTVTTAACGRDGHGTGDARSLGAGGFTAAPGTGAGSRKEVVAGRFTVPEDAEPGNYGIGVLCDNGKEATGDLVVQSLGGRGRTGQLGQQPSGHVKTGVGGSVGPDTTQIAVGAAVLAATAAGGTWLLRRRASGAQGS
ncbi:hypothetical protein [Streptomyces sp. FIT100]|uniref:hypothetical protein n=1 Tax=Streptomyces sp. FIT100 TaxID=2837956 RepID=UPI0021C841A4|nr:hypothetical protein [Streptomyces sp. FIT100]UUN26782.1 hypothetical protein KK483_10460 [Streptomyces sp. FIT100]